MKKAKIQQKPETKAILEKLLKTILEDVAHHADHDAYMNCDVNTQTMYEVKGEFDFFYPKIGFIGLVTYIVIYCEADENYGQFSFGLRNPILCYQDPTIYYNLYYQDINVAIFSDTKQYPNISAELNKRLENYQDIQIKHKLRINN